MTDTRKLVAAYAEHGSEAAFKELADRYVNLVHSTALRLMNGEAHLAQDVVQTVFADLARTAGTLKKEVRLGGWLHRHTCFVAGKMIRGERRRQFRERQAMEMNSLNEAPGLDFGLIAPILDDAINELGETERTAVLLRFYEQQTFHAVGEATGCTEDSARMRVNRALEKLARLIKRRGVTSTAAMLDAALASGAIQTAPSGMAVAVSTLVLGGGAAASGSLGIAAGMTAMQKVLVTSLIAAAAGTVIFGADHTTTLRAEVQTFRQQQETANAQYLRLQGELNEATDRLADLETQNGRLKANSNESELLRLRGKLAGLKTVAALSGDDSLTAAAEKWLDQVNQLKAYLEKHPEKAIPEMDYLPAARWLNAVEDPAPDHGRPEDRYRNAVDFLKMEAETDFGVNVVAALRKYSEAYNGQSPTDLAQLQPFCSDKVENLLQQLYEIEPASILPPEKMKNMNLSPDSVVVVRKKRVINNLTRNAFFTNGFTSWQAPPGPAGP